MIPLVDPNDRILLQPLIPKSATQTQGQLGYGIMKRDYSTLKTCISNCRKEGIVSEDEVTDVQRDLDKVLAFFKDISSRERTVFNEGVRDEPDSSLKKELDESFDSFCRYLDTMAETLFRLRNTGHLADKQYQSLIRSFESLRDLHRRILSYLDDLYL